jgi:hypothetical protein
MPRPPKPPDREASPRFRKHRKKQSQNATSSPVSLRQIARSRLSDDNAEFKAYLREIRNNSDRTACIVLSANLERWLERAILVRIDSNIEDEELLNELLFDRDGSMSTFDRNIRLGRALELYPADVQKLFDVVRRIRNAFAHTAVPLTFETDAIKDQLKKLPGYLDALATLVKSRKHFSDERKKFVALCYLLTGSLLDKIDQLTEQNRIKHSAIERHRDEL